MIVVVVLACVPVLVLGLRISRKASALRFRLVPQAMCTSREELFFVTRAGNLSPIVIVISVANDHLRYNSAVCPSSGVCVTGAHLCSEGDPFEDKKSLYYQEAMAANFAHSEAEARKAELHKAAVTRANSVGNGTAPDHVQMKEGHA